MTNYLVNVVCPQGHPSTLLREKVERVALQELRRFEVLYEGTVQIPAVHCPQCQPKAA